MFRLIAVGVLFVLTACGPSTDASDDAGRVGDTVSETLPEPEITPIDVTGEVCGGVTGVDCPFGFYCEREDGVCLETLDGPGTCQPVPDVCTQEYIPVCGCDGVTYGNRCEAAAAGVSVAIEGSCGEADTL